MAISQAALGYYGNLFGNGPHEPHQFTGNGHDHLIGMFASGNESPVTFTESHLGLPTRACGQLMIFRMHNGIRL